MFRSLFLLVTLAFVSGSAYIWTGLPELKERLNQLIPTSFSQILPSKELTCLEPRYSVEQLLQKHQKTIKEKGGEWEAARLELYPQLLMEVKYIKNQESYESILVWSLHQGEMILNTETWSTTHGYDDCLAVHASREEMRIVHALASSSGGILDRGSLIEKIKLDPVHIDEWLERCRRKHLVVQIGSQWRLHIQRPLLSQDPVTHWRREDLVQLSSQEVHIVPASFREAQIIELVQAAFGTDFAIKRSQIIYLPVYSISSKAIDGSKKTLKLNAYSNSAFLL